MDKNKLKKSKYDIFTTKRDKTLRMGLFLGGFMIQWRRFIIERSARICKFIF